MATFQFRANELTGSTGLSVQLYPRSGGPIANPGGDALTETPGSNGLFTATISETLSGNFLYYVYQTGYAIGYGSVQCSSESSLWNANATDNDGGSQSSIGTGTAAEIRTEIAAIDAILSSGVNSITVDGTTTQYNLDSLRKRRNTLQQSLNKLSAREAMRRPVASSIYLGGF